MPINDVYMFLGFCLAAYSIVANDAIQTLGTFLSSNAHRPWWVLWIYACSILLVVFVYGWYVNFGDVTYGRLAKFPEPAMGFTWLHIIPPIFILILTRYGVPVSTTFLILTIFVPSNMGAVLLKSVYGYVLAVGVAVAIYFFVTRTVERYFIETHDKPVSKWWVALQWGSTGFLWSQWLIQDLANIFIYMPRHLSLHLLFFAVLVLLTLHAVLFYFRGGAIQGIVTSKTNTQDIRSATIIDFLFGFILLFFKEYSNMPMSTTFVFLGLLAGREFALTLRLNHREMKETGKVVATDVIKAGIGLGVSVVLALTLPLLYKRVEGVTGDVPTAQATEPATNAAGPALLHELAQANAAPSQN
jgi:phosphate/sulfate permease